MIRNKDLLKGQDIRDPELNYFTKDESDRLHFGNLRIGEREGLNRQIWTFS